MFDKESGSAFLTSVKDFATKAHGSQKRKYSDQPYVNHCRRVANLVSGYTDDENVIAAAWLHDVAEDVSADVILEASYGVVPSAVYIRAREYYMASIKAWRHSREGRLGLLRVLWGNSISSLVEEVTNVSKPEDGNRAFRKALDRDHLAKASRDGQLIKLADLIDNGQDIQHHDPKFAKTYMLEKEALLKVLDKVHGNCELWDLANGMVSTYIRKHILNA